MGGTERTTLISQCDPQSNLITLTRHLIAQQQRLSQATGDFTLLMVSIQLAIKYVSSCVRKAGIANLTGLAGSGTNTSGDEQKKLDVIANEVFVNSLTTSQRVTTMVSEEEENAIVVTNNQRGQYCVVFDPLDGSSNIDCGASIGTIFGIYRVDDCIGKDTDVLRPGREMVAAGYALYGSSTQMVLSYGMKAGVHCYTLDPSMGEFILSIEDIKIKDTCSIYSINEGRSIYWDDNVRKYLNSVKNPSKKGDKPFTARYIGSMVGDIHRTILYGGIFMYPADFDAPQGKLRLLYECFPMAFIVENTGGSASNGYGPILDVVPTSIHCRSGLFLGSRSEVEKIERMYRENPVKFVTKE